MFIDKHTNSIHTYIDRLYQEDSPEVGPIEILRLFFWPKNGQVPSDIPSDTKNSIRVVHKF